MTRIVQVTYRDDYSGETVPEDQIAEAFPFSVGGDRYVLDATQGTQDAIRRALAPFIAAARVVVGSGKAERYLTAEEHAALNAPNPLPPVPETPDGNGNGHQVNGAVREPTNEEIRAWAKTSPEWAHRAGARGSAFGEVKQAFLAAHA